MQALLFEHNAQAIAEIEALIGATSGRVGVS